MDGALRAAVEAATGGIVTAASAVHGGDVATSSRVDLADGRTVFAKTDAGGRARWASTEAWGLRWLAEGIGRARVDGALAVPEVLAVHDGGDGTPAHLVLGWVDTGGRGDEAALGRALAALHLTGAPCFGREDRRTTGSRALPNDPCVTWAEFYADRRLRPLARIARDTGALPEGVVRDLEGIAGRLDGLGGAPEPPARLHGDLWAGNRLAGADGRSWLVDPAAHGGHREFDLAMMRLFGGFGPACFDAYDEATPLADGWAERVALHQVAPLVVHAVKFGGAYVAAAADAIRVYC